MNDDTPLAQRIKLVELATVKSDPQVLQHDIHLSDYHHANLQLLLAMRESWLNLVLQWLGGLHDEVHAGCFLRSYVDFSRQRGIMEARTTHADFDSLIKLKDSCSSCYQFLTDNDVIEFMLCRPQVMVTLYQNIPEIVYGFHEPDRYSFAWN